MSPEQIKSLLEKARATKDVKLLALVQQYLETPLLSFRPRPDRPALYDEQSSYVNEKFSGLAVALGGNGSGKSYCSAVKAARFVLDTPPPRPNTPFWCVSQSYDIACGVMWATHLSNLIHPQFISSISWYNKAKNWPSAVKLKKHKNGNNWIIEFKSADSERKRLQAASVGGFWIDEQVKKEILMEVWARCREYGYPGSMMYSLTPLEYDPDLEDIYRNREKFPNWKFYRMNSELNAKLVEGYMALLVASEVEERKQTRLTGEFASFQGIVYKSFSHDDHVVQPFDIPPTWTRLRGLDIGFADNHPTAMVWAARDPDDCYYIYDEYRASKLSVEEHVETIEGKHHWPIDLYHGPTYADYGNAQVRHEFGLAGLPTTAANKDILVGIACVQRLLREKRLVIFENCKNLIAEFKSYSWHPVLDRPVKAADDLQDALRYLCLSDARTLKSWQPLSLPERKWKFVA